MSRGPNRHHGEELVILANTLSDFDRKVVNEYGVTFQNLGGVEGYVSANRAVLILDKEGVVRYRWVASPNPGVEPDYDELKSVVSGLS